MLINPKLYIALILRWMLTTRDRINKKPKNTTMLEQFRNPTATVSKSIPLTHIYLLAHFRALVRAIQ